MSHQSETLFSGAFYLDRSYGLSLVPTLVKLFKTENFVEKKESDLLKNITRISLDGKNVSYGSEASNTDQRVVVLDFKQPVVKFSTYNWLGTQTYIRILNQLKTDPTVLGVVMDMDTGGGQVYGTPEMYDTVAEFAKVKPIGVYTSGYLCSGGMYIAAPATTIIANRRADAIGSIGAYTTIVNYDGILEHFGGKVQTIYSDLSPDKNKGYRGVVDGTDVDFKNYIKEELNPMVLTFHADMKSARPQMNELVFKGGVWNGVDAVAMGLVDENGTLYDTIAKVFELSNSSNSNKNNNNSKKKTMSKKTKSFPAIQTILGIKDEGIATISTLSGKTGVQLTEAQLETLNNALVEKETAVTAANVKVTEAEGKVTKLETAIDAALVVGKLDVEASASIESKITLLGAKVLEYGNKPGAKKTIAKSEGDSFDENDALVNEADAHNELYNKL